MAKSSIIRWISTIQSVQSVPIEPYWMSNAWMGNGSGCPLERPGGGWSWMKSISLVCTMTSGGGFKTWRGGGPTPAPEGATTTSTSSSSTPDPATLPIVLHPKPSPPPRPPLVLLRTTGRFPSLASPCPMPHQGGGPRPIHPDARGMHRQCSSWGTSWVTSPAARSSGGCWSSRCRWSLQPQGPGLWRR